MFYLIMFSIWIALAFFTEWLDKPRQEANKKEIENASDYELNCYDFSIFGDWKIQDMVHNELMRRQRRKTTERFVKAFGDFLENENKKKKQIKENYTK